MSFFSFLIISLIIQNISPLPYCDVEQYCSDCEYCGYSYHDYCSCDFYDAFCMNSDRTEYFEPNFLLNYDGCLTTNKEYDVCSSSSLSLKEGEKYVIDFDSTYKTEFLCYYYFKGSDYDNKFTFTVYSSGSQEFDIYYVIYPRDGNAFVYRIPSPSINNYFVYTSNNVKKGSIYFDIGRGQNLDKVSIEIIYNEYDDYPPSGPSGSTSKSSSSNTWLIVGIIIGAVVLIALIIVGVCLYRYCKRKGAIKVANVSTSNMNY